MTTTYLNNMKIFSIELVEDGAGLIKFAITLSKNHEQNEFEFLNMIVCQQNQDNSKNDWFPLSITIYYCKEGDLLPHRSEEIEIMEYSNTIGNYITYTYDAKTISSEEITELDIAKYIYWIQNSDSCP